MELNPENEDYEDCRPVPEAAPIKLELPGYMAERIAEASSSTTEDVP